jgi:hypothetical protein
MAQFRSHSTSLTLKKTSTHSDYSSAHSQAEHSIWGRRPAHRRHQRCISGESDCSNTVHITQLNSSQEHLPTRLTRIRRRSISRATHQTTTRSQQVFDTFHNMTTTPSTPSSTTSSASTLTHSFLHKHGLPSTHKTVRKSSKRAQRRAQGLKKSTRESTWHQIGQYFKPTKSKLNEERKANQDNERKEDRRQAKLKK